MDRNEIFEKLVNIIGPLRTQPQQASSNYEKFEDLLKHCLSQPALQMRTTGISFPNLQSAGLPEQINVDLEKIADQIILDQATRTPNDPVYWIRRRNISVTAGIEESIENYIKPAFSFGPFITSDSNEQWFDFYEDSRLLRFEILEGGMPDFLIIKLPADVSLPAVGSHNDALSFDDCTLWISSKTVGVNADKKYIGLRAKKCVLSFTGLVIVQASGFVSILAQGFQLSFQPFDEFTGKPGQSSPVNSRYPSEMTLSFTGTKWSLQSSDKASIDPFGDTINFAKAENVTPLLLEGERFIHIPLAADKDLLEIENSGSETFHLNGKSKIIDTGWYFPIIDINNSLGLSCLGMLIFSGYIGFRGTERIALDWPGLENGKLTIGNFLILTRPGRSLLKYSYTALSRTTQNLRTWKSAANNQARSIITLNPGGTGDGYCLQDNQQMEALFQPATISAKTDRPINANQQSFDIAGNVGAVVFIKIEDKTNIALLGTYPKPIANAEKKRRIPQSLCLRNALLVTDNPFSIFVGGILKKEQIIAEGSFYLGFPVFRMINTLPDPYITNQQYLQDQELFNFNNLWRSGEDTLPDKFDLSITACVRWNDENTTLGFSLNNSHINNRRDDRELLDRFRDSGNLCRSLENESALRNEDIQRINSFDPENVTGAFGYLQWLPGNLSLVDISESVNRWGVSFSDTVSEDKLILAENLGFPSGFPVRIKNMDLVSSGRMTRLFTLPHIQWEPVLKIKSPAGDEPGIPSIINFTGNDNPTRISTSNKDEVELIPRNLYNFIIDGFNSEGKPFAMAANFSLPFGICANAYFNPKILDKLPSAKALFNEPEFSDKKTGKLKGGMQLHVEAIAPPNAEAGKTDNHLAYFIGSAIQLPANGIQVNILGDIIGKQFNKEFSSGANAKVPLERIDFSGYGASIFSNWLNESANFGAVSQVKFDVLIGRTAHEVIQIKSILFPWGVPVVRSIVIQRKNTGIVTRYDSGWVAQGPGVFNFLSNNKNANEENNPYTFHPGMVKGIFNVTEIKDTPSEMDIQMSPAGVNINFSGVHFNGDIEIENIVKGALPKKEGQGSRTHSAGQFGYVMLADASKFNDNTKLMDIFPSHGFKELLNNSKLGGNLGGPVNALIDIGGTGQKIQATRVDVSANKGPNESFIVAVKGTVELPKEGSWAVVKCLPSKAVIPVAQNEAVPIIRNGILSIHRENDIVSSKTEFGNSNYCIGDPFEIDNYIFGAPAPQLQYSLLQSTDAQKLLFRRPSFTQNEPKIHTEIPDLADAFRLLNCKAIFPDLSKTLSLPDKVTSLNIVGDGSGLKFDQSFFEGADNLNDFVPRQLTNDPATQEFELLNESGLQIIICYGSKGENPSPSAFKVDLSSDAVADALDAERKRWETVNKDVAIKVNLGDIKPLLTLRGTFRSEAGKDPEFENPQCELGEELQAVKDILQILALLAGKGQNDTLKVVMGNSPGVYNYKMSIDQNIPVIQFPSVEEITLTTPPLLIIEASLSLGIFFNLSLSPDPKNLIKPGAGAVFGFEGMIQIQLITIGIAAAYGVGITKVKAYVDFTDPKPIFEFTFGFGATVIVDLPVVGLASITRSFSLAGNINSGHFKAVAGQMLRGVLSLAGGLLVVSIQIEGSAGVERKDKVNDDPKTTAIFEMIFSLDVSLAFVISYDFEEKYTEEIALN